MDLWILMGFQRVEHAIIATYSSEMPLESLEALKRTT